MSSSGADNRRKRRNEVGARESPNSHRPKLVSETCVRYRNASRPLQSGGTVEKLENVQSKTKSQRGGEKAKRKARDSTEEQRERKIQKREVAGDAQKTVKVEKNTKVSVEPGHKSTNTDVKKSSYGRVLRETQHYRDMPSTRKLPERKKPPAAKGKLRNKKPGTSRGTGRLMPAASKCPSRKSEKKPPTERPAPASQVDALGKTELHRAAVARLGEEARIGDLLEMGFDPRATDSAGRTPLHCALYVGSREGAWILLRGDGHNSCPDVQGATPLHIAVEKRMGDVAWELLLRGVELHGKDQAGRDPLFVALSCGDYGVARVILAAYTWRDIKIDWERIKVIPGGMRYCTAVLSRHERELRSMRDTRVEDTKVTFHDIRERAARRLAPLLPVDVARRVARGDGLVREFRHHAHFIARKLATVEERRVLADRALRGFSVLPPEWSPLPWTFANMLVTWLGDDDLKSWVIATDVRSRRVRPGRRW